MFSSHLSNYLRSQRKRSALSQEDVAFLLGTRNAGQVCRNERFIRVPNLEIALAYEVIYGLPVRELFLGIYQEIANQVIARAKTLDFKLERLQSDPKNSHKRQIIQEIIRQQERLE